MAVDGVGRARDLVGLTWVVKALAERAGAEQTLQDCVHVARIAEVEHPRETRAEDRHQFGTAFRDFRKVVLQGVVVLHLGQCLRRFDGLLHVDREVGSLTSSSQV